MHFEKNIYLDYFIKNYVQEITKFLGNLKLELV